MSELISGKEALIALANGEEVEYEVVAGRDVWNRISSMSVNLILADNFKFRLKPRTITINGIEVPAPFEPKEDGMVYILDDGKSHGYRTYAYEVNDDAANSFFGLWRTEEEIKQVVAALRIAFGKK